MKICKLSFNGFRNIENTVIEPCESVNMICGENAQGKTNILEGIWLFSGLKSFRGAKDVEFINFGGSFAKLKMEFYSQKREQKAEITVQGKRKAVLNGVKLGSCTGFIGKIPVVVFSPSFMALVKDGPSERRKFTDSAICQIKPSYAVILSEYNKLLLQRNSLLKDVQFEPSLLDILDVIDIKLADTGEKIKEERKKYLGLLSERTKEIYDGLSDGREKIELLYSEKITSPDKSLFDLLKENRKNDIINKTTSVGPHRDDMEIKINGISARIYGSQGQQRSCAIAIKLGEAEIIKSVTGEQPVVLLDDVMSELDVNRQDYILNHIKDRQVFITCCEPTAKLRMYSGKVFNISKGAIV